MVKQKSKCLTLKEKSKILEEIEKGMTVSLLVKKYGIAKSTVFLIKKKKDVILEAVDNMLNPSKRRTLKVSAYKLMEKKL